MSDKSKKVLLLGSSYSAVQLLLNLKKRGFHVSVCGSFKNDPCHIIGDASFFVDYSDPKLIDAIVTENHFDYLVPSCNDTSYHTGSWIAAQHGFHGFDNDENTQIIHVKSHFRENTNGRFKVPLAFSDLNAAKKFLNENSENEVIVKPIDSFSGKGVSRVTHSGHLDQAFETAKTHSRMGGVIIEQFVPGQLYSHSAFIKNGIVFQDFFVDEYCLTYPYQVDGSNHPSHLPDTTRALVRAEINKLCTNLGLVDGLLHTQFIANENDFWIIECMRRCPGDLYYYLIQYSTGVDYVDLFLKPFIGEKYEGTTSTPSLKNIMRHTVSSKQDLFFSDYSVLMKNREIRHFPLKSSGDLLKAAPFDKAAIIFIAANDSAEMFELTPKLNQMVVINRY